MLICVCISIFKILATFKNEFICVYVFVYACVHVRAYLCVCVCVPSGAQGGQKRASGPLNLELLAVVCHQTWILGTELGKNKKHS